MTKLFLSAAMLAMCSVASASQRLQDEEVLIRGMDQELVRARRVLKGKGGGVQPAMEFSMSFDMSYPTKKSPPVLPKKKVHEASKQGMAKLSKAPKEPKAAKSVKGEKAPPPPQPTMPKMGKLPKGLFDHEMSMSMSMATDAPTRMPIAAVEGTDTLAPVARR
ncbi:hypothetical protein MPSEU_000336400 [Mayamaea pseudoterrestris]|nr:hypothetical protein MPSEU_000336400 [Mayamaea pseudoterrestris]